MRVIPRNEASSPVAVGDDEPRAERESSAGPRALNGASQDCTPGTEPPHACAARSIFENRTEHSIRAENAARIFKPLRKTRSVLSAAVDAAMEELAISNVVVADACGVTEKTVRQWRGRALLAGEVAKPMPSDMLVHLPDALYHRVSSAILGLRAVMRNDRKVAR